MATARQKVKSNAPTFPVPQSRDEVDRAIARIGVLQRERIRVHTDKDEKMALVSQEHKGRLEPLEEEIRQLQQGVQAWCEPNRESLTLQGKVKFHNFPSGMVNWRMRPPSVALRVQEMVLDALKQRGLTRFIRIKEEVNKEAILAEPEAIAGIPGITIKQGEDFVVTPFETRLEEVA